jgi:hypothetical protein
MAVLGEYAVLMLPGAQGSTSYSFTGTYGSYSVAISFDTSLTGTALDNLSAHDITTTVSNIISFNITGTVDQVVTEYTGLGPDGTHEYYVPSAINAIALPNRFLMKFARAQTAPKRRPSYIAERPTLD